MRCCEFLFQVETPRWINNRIRVERLALNDPEKADWLSKMWQLHGSKGDIPSVIRNWLKRECELIGVSGPSV
jgi:hypothetical protein